MSYEAFETWRDQAVREPKLSIVIPAYNESKRILPTIAAIAVIVSGFERDWELIISDDGSKDKTSDLVEALRWHNLRVIRHANTGKGGAVQRGVLAARGEMILFADADNSTPIEELPRLIQKLEQGYGVVVASREGEGAIEENKSLLRHLVSKILRLTLRLGSGVSVRDTQCGFKLFSKEAAKRIFGLQRVLGFSFDLELLYLAQKLGYRIAEIPVHWFDAPDSKVDAVRDSLKFLRDLWLIRKYDFQGLYPKDFQATDTKGGNHAPSNRQHVSAQ